MILNIKLKVQTPASAPACASVASETSLTLFTPFVPICSQSSSLFAILKDSLKNKTHRFQCFSANDVMPFWSYLQNANSFYVGGFKLISVWSSVGIQHNWAIKGSPSRDLLGDKYYWRGWSGRQIRAAVTENFWRSLRFVLIIPPMNRKFVTPERTTGVTTEYPAFSKAPPKKIDTWIRSGLDHPSP